MHVVHIISENPKKSTACRMLFISSPFRSILKSISKDFFKVKIEYEWQKDTALPNFSKNFFTWFLTVSLLNFLRLYFRCFVLCTILNFVLYYTILLSYTLSENLIEVQVYICSRVGFQACETVSISSMY